MAHISHHKFGFVFLGVLLALLCSCSSSDVRRGERAEQSGVMGELPSGLRRSVERGISGVYAGGERQVVGKDSPDKPSPSYWGEHSWFSWGSYLGYALLVIGGSLLIAGMVFLPKIYKSAISRSAGGSEDRECDGDRYAEHWRRRW